MKLQNSPQVKVVDAPNHFLLQIEPLEDDSKECIEAWLKASQDYVKEKIALYGGLYIKGFKIDTAQDFEDIALQIDTNLCDKHPFNCSSRAWHTKYTCEVQSPDIKKSLVPKGMHNEDAYVGHIPKTILFHPLEPAAEGGETLLSDCQEIYEHLPDSVKQKFVGQKMRNDLVMHNDVLLVNGRIPNHQERLKNLGRSYGAYEVSRVSENLTRFRFEIPAVIKNEKNGKPLWFNLTHIFPKFGFNVYFDIWFAYKHRGGWVNRLRSFSIIFLTFLKDLRSFLREILNRDPENPEFLSEIGNYTLLSEGIRLTFKDRVYINLAIWKSTCVVPLGKGEIVALDNRRISHGRMPFKGRRVFLTSMGSLTSVENFEPLA